MPRYEFSEGSSNKFWEIALKGKAFTTTWGRIGTAGQSATKTFGSPAQAEKEYEKLVAEKIAKGYRLSSKNGKASAQDQGDEEDDEKAAPAGRYFEFSEGGSSKFWEITLDGKSFVTRYGRIGTDGQKTSKKCQTPNKALEEAEKLIAEKVRKGYVEKGTQADGGGARTLNARNPELEKAILADPDDEAAYLVYADWLQGQGDPRGELITLSAQAEKTKDRKLKNTADKLFAENEAYLLGPLAEYRKTFDGKDAETMTWRWGFIQSLRVAFDHFANDEKLDMDLGEVLAKFLAHPSCRFVTEVVVGLNRQDPDQVYQGILDVLAKRPPPALRSLFIGDYEYPEETEISWTNLGDYGKLWAKLPGLRKLILQGGEFKLGTIDLPELRHAEFRTGGMSDKSVKSIVSAHWPKLEHLEMWFGRADYGAGGDVDDIKPLLDGKGLPALRTLGLKNCEFTDDIARVIGKSKILPQLETLDLSMGTMTDDGVDALLSSKAAFAKLKALDLSRNYISDKGRRRLKGLCGGLEAGDQREADEYDDEVHRYAAVGE